MTTYAANAYSGERELSASACTRYCCCCYWHKHCCVVITCTAISVGVYVCATVRCRCVGWRCSASASCCTSTVIRSCTVSCFTCCRALDHSSPSTRSPPSSQAPEQPSCYSASSAATVHAPKASASCGWSVSCVGFRWHPENYSTPSCSHFFLMKRGWQLISSLTFPFHVFKTPASSWNRAKFFVFSFCLRVFPSAELKRVIWNESIKSTHFNDKL